MSADEAPQGRSRRSSATRQVFLRPRSRAAECDPLHPQADATGDGSRRPGWASALRYYPGMIHGYFGLGGDLAGGGRGHGRRGLGVAPGAGLGGDVAVLLRLRVLPLHAIVVGAGLSGLYLLHRLRELGLSALVLEQARVSAGRGSGTATRARAATSEHHLLDLLPGRTSSSRSGRGPSATPPSRRSSAISSTSPTASTCAATSAFSTRVGGRGVQQERARFWSVTTGSGERLSAGLPHHGDGGYGIPGLERFAGELRVGAVWPHGRRGGRPASAWA